MRRRVAGVAGEDQPVVGMGRQRLHGAAVGLEATCRSLMAQSVTAGERAVRGAALERQSSSVTGRSSPVALDGQRQAMLGRGPGLPELPAAGSSSKPGTNEWSAAAAAAA